MSEGNKRFSISKWPIVTMLALVGLTHLFIFTHYTFILITITDLYINYTDNKLRYLWILSAHRIFFELCFLLIFNFQIFKRIYNMILLDKWKIFIPTYKRRMAILSFFNAVNFAISLYGIIAKPKNFPSYFLAVFMVNLLLYFGFYILMKVIHSERFHRISLFYVIVSILCWATALYCFINHPTDWQKPPSLSRIENKDCLFFDFYDIHDTWHFLSAMSMFFSFMGLQNMDDCLIHTERNKIAVF